VSIACEVLEVSASGYFTWARQHKAKRKGPPGRYSDEALLTAIYAEVKQEYGWPRMHKELATTDSKHNLSVAPDLVQRKFNPEAPNQLWSGDITYIATDEGWVYLAYRH
jgi:putative transposase